MGVCDCFDGQFLVESLVQRVVSSARNDERISLWCCLKICEVKQEGIVRRSKSLLYLSAQARANASASAERSECNKRRSRRACLRYTLSLMNLGGECEYDQEEN